MMDQDKMDRWLADGRRAMAEAAPGLAMSGLTIRQATEQILEIGYRAVIKAAMHDIASEMIGKMIRDLPLAQMAGGGVVGETAVRRFSQ